MLPPNRQLKKLWEIVLEMSSGFACNKNYERLWWYVHLRTHNISIDWTLNFDLIVEIDPKKVDIKKNYIQKWDILFNNTNSKELVWKTALVDKNYPYAYSNHITKFQLKEGYSPKYIVFFLNYLWGRGYFQEKCNKWIWQAWFNNSMLKEIQIPLPPFEEQKKIVAYLDELNATITKLKSGYQAQLTALDKIRNSSLDLAFWGSRERTYNLNNWKWVKLGEVCEIIGWGTPSKGNIAYYEKGTIPRATVKDMKTDYIWMTEIFITEAWLKNSSANLVPKNWVVIATRVGLWKVCKLGQITAINQDLKWLVACKNLNADFLFWFLKSISEYIISQWTGATVQGVKLEFIKNIETPLPSLEEQQQIITHLDQVHSHITILKSQITAQITRSDELWQSSLQKILQSGISEMKE